MPPPPDEEAPSSPPAPPPKQTDFAPAYAAIEKSGRDILEREQTELAPAIAEGQRRLGEPRPDKPKLERAPAAPKMDVAGSADGWMQANALIAGLFGAFSRNHATTALNAFGAGLKGYSEGNTQAFERSYKTWKAESENVIQNNKAMLDEYKAVMDDRKIGVEEQMAQIQLIASKYKDPLAYEAAKAQNFTQLAQIVEKQEYALQQFNQSTRQLDQTYDLERKRLELEKDKLEKSARIANLNTPDGVKQFAEWYQKLPQGQRVTVDHVMGMIHPGNSMAQLLSGSLIAKPGDQPGAAKPAPSVGAPSGGGGAGTSPATAAPLPAQGEPVAGKWYNTSQGVGKYQGGGFFTTPDEEFGSDQAGKTLPLPPE